MQEFQLRGREQSYMCALGSRLWAFCDGEISVNTAGVKTTGSESACHLVGSTQISRKTMSIM